MAKWTVEFNDGTGDYMVCNPQGLAVIDLGDKEEAHDVRNLLNKISDTCTPNEKLEELLKDWGVRLSNIPSTRKAQVLRDCMRELLEVMK